MIHEIGIVVGLYVLTRLVPVNRPRVANALAVFTAVITILVIIDLSVRRFTSVSLFSVLRAR
jgi:hypothetical protein